MHIFDGSTSSHEESDRLKIFYRWSVFRGIGIGFLVAVLPAILMFMGVGFVDGDITVSASIGSVVALVLVLFQRTYIDLNRERLRVRTRPIPLPGLTLRIDELAKIAWYEYRPTEWGGDRARFGACGKLIAVMQDGKRFCLVRTSFGVADQLERMKRCIDEFLKLPRGNELEGTGEVVRVWNWIAIVCLVAAIAWIAAYGPSTNPDVQTFSNIQELVSKDLLGSVQWTDFRRIRLLNLKDCDELGDEIAPLLRSLKHIEELNIRGTRVTDSIIPTLAKLATLRQLDIRETLISEEGADQLRTLLSECQVISANAIDETAASGDPDRNMEDLLLATQGIATVRNNAALGIEGKVILENVVAVQFEPLESGTPDLEKVVNALSGHENVALVFDKCTVRVDQMKQLSGMNNLRGLSLAAAPITDEILASITDHSGLLFLNLRDTKVTDLGVKTVNSFESLRILDLRGCDITDASIPHLRVIKSLEYLDIRDTSIHEDGARELHEILSNVKIVFN